MVGVNGNADTGGDEELAAIDVPGLPERLTDPFGDLCCVFNTGDVRAQHRELIAPHTSNGVAVTDPASEAVCDALQELITHVVSQGVVDWLEPVQV